MGYFRELPDIFYQSNLLHKVSSQEYVVIKNLFRKVKIQDWILDNVAFFEKYRIEDGERPDTIAEEYYGSPDYDWIVILTAGISNIKEEWPLSNYDLYRYVEDKYGLTEINNVHHYETIRVEDNRGRLILPAGQRVDAGFTIPTPYDASATNFYVGVRPESDNIDYRSVNSNISPVTGISNYQYEVEKNEAKSEINLMKPIYLQQFLNDMRTLMNYKSSSQTVDKKLITTENTRLIEP